MRAEAVNAEAAYRRAFIGGWTAARTSGTALASFVLDYWAHPAFTNVPILALAVFSWIVAFVPMELYRIRRVLRPIALGVRSLPATAGIVVIALTVTNFIVPRIVIALGHGDIMGTDRAYRIEPIVAISDFVFAPFFEELVFQGWLQTVLQKLGAFPAIIITTTAFTLVHIPETFGHLEPSVRIWMVIFPALIAYAVVRQTTKSLAATIVCHSIDNVLTTLQNSALLPR